MQREFVVSCEILMQFLLRLEASQAVNLDHYFSPSDLSNFQEPGGCIEKKLDNNVTYI